MAEEQLKNTEEFEPENDSNQQEGKSKIKRIGKIFLILAIIAVQGIAAFAIINKNYSDIKKTVDGFSQQGGVYYKLDNIIINPAHSNGERYLILSLAFEMNNSTDVANAEKMNVEIIDRINSHLIRKTSEELSSVEKRDILKSELQKEINDVLEKKAVRNLFITKYVIQ